MTFFERDSEIRRVQLMKDIAIAEAEEKAIREILEQERQDEKEQKTSIKLDPGASPFVPKLPLDKLQETRAEENQEKGALVSALEENQSIKQERDPTGLQPIFPTLSVQEDNTNNPCRESPKLAYGDIKGTNMPASKTNRAQFTFDTTEESTLAS